MYFNGCESSARSLRTTIEIGRHAPGEIFLQAEGLTAKSLRGGRDELVVVETLVVAQKGS